MKLLKLKDIPEYSTGTGYIITRGNSFLYEVSVYKIWQNRVECWGSKFYSSKTPLKILKNAIYKPKDDYILAKFIDWLEAPIDYIISNNFKQVNKNARVTRRNSRSNRGNKQNNRTKK